MTSTFSSKQNVDYGGRTVDLLLLKTVLGVPSVNRNVQIDVSDVSDEPMIVTGIEKLVQRYAILFLNAIGSTKFVPGHGTNLIPMASSGRIYNYATLESAAAESNLLARSRIIKSDVDGETPDDERLVKSDVVDISFSREEARAMISIRLTTAAGQSYVYVIPVNVGIRG